MAGDTHDRAIILRGFGDESDEVRSLIEELPIRTDAVSIHEEGSDD